MKHGNYEAQFVEILVLHAKTIRLPVLENDARRGDDQPNTRANNRMRHQKQNSTDNFNNYSKDKVFLNMLINGVEGGREGI